MPSRFDPTSPRNSASNTAFAQTQSTIMSESIKESDPIAHETCWISKLPPELWNLVGEQARLQDLLANFSEHNSNIP